MLDHWTTDPKPLSPPETGTQIQLNLLNEITGVSITLDEQCPRCKGSGIIKKICAFCKGTKKDPIQQLFDSDKIGCNTCNSKGTRNNHCNKCEGKGVLLTESGKKIYNFVNKHLLKFATEEYHKRNLT